MPAQDRQNVTCLLVLPETSAGVAKQLKSIHDLQQVGQQRNHVQPMV